MLIFEFPIYPIIDSEIKLLENLSPLIIARLDYWFTFYFDWIYKEVIGHIIRHSTRIEYHRFQWKYFTWNLHSMLDPPFTTWLVWKIIKVGKKESALQGNIRMYIHRSVYMSDITNCSVFRKIIICLSVYLYWSLYSFLLNVIFQLKNIFSLRKFQLTLLKTSVKESGVESFRLFCKNFPLSKIWC